MCTSEREVCVHVCVCVCVLVQGMCLCEVGVPTELNI